MAISARRIQRAQTQAATYQGTSIGSLGYHLDDTLFGGIGSGSWANTPMPANTTIHPQSAAGVQWVCDHIYGVGSPPKPPFWPNINLWPTINTSVFTATVNVVEYGQYPPVPVYIEPIIGTHRTDANKFRSAAMMYSGVQIPPGFQPTDDSDGQGIFYYPNYVYAGDPTNVDYHGLYVEFWGLMSPAQNAARSYFGPNGEHPEGAWTAKLMGRMVGVNNRLTAHPVDRTDNVAIAGSYAIKAPNDTSANAGYAGWGYAGRAEAKGYIASASSLPGSQYIITMRDVQRMQITHPMGFALPGGWTGADADARGVPANQRGWAPPVWPAMASDGASVGVLPQGSRLRLPANFPRNQYPSGLPVAWRGWYDMFIDAWINYGIIHVDTTGANFGFRGEPGLQALYPAGFSGKTFIELLPFPDLQMIAVGNDNDFYPGA
ncbi:MAG: hypothetical protein ACM3JF_00635 [Sphaerimonospora mesophila]